MNRRDFATLSLGATGMIMGSEAAAASSLEAKVDTLLREHVAAWNREDLDAMFDAFTEDAHWVNIVGMHWRGRDQVKLAHQAYFNIMFRGVKQRLIETESIVPLHGGGAIVVARLAVDAFRQPNGVTKPPSEDRLTLVLVPRADRLAIKHGANIGIVAEAQQHDPVKQSQAIISGDASRLRAKNGRRAHVNEWQVPGSSALRLMSAIGSSPPLPPGAPC